MFICEAADELFHWDDFALDLFDADKDEVVSLLTITTVDGQRVEIPASPQPKTANALVQRVIARGAELISADETGDKDGTTMIAPIRKGEKRHRCAVRPEPDPARYTHGDLHTLQTLADQCSGALERVRAEEELRHSQRRFRDLFENSPDAIFVEDMQGNVLDANRAALPVARHGARVADRQKFHRGTGAGRTPRKGAGGISPAGQRPDFLDGKRKPPRRRPRGAGGNPRGARGISRASRPCCSTSATSRSGSRWRRPAQFGNPVPFRLGQFRGRHAAHG